MILIFLLIISHSIVTLWLHQSVLTYVTRISTLACIKLLVNRTNVSLLMETIVFVYRIVIFPCLSKAGEICTFLECSTKLGKFLYDSYLRGLITPEDQTILADPKALDPNLCRQSTYTILIILISQVQSITSLAMTR